MGKVALLDGTEELQGGRNRRVVDRAGVTALAVLAVVSALLLQGHSQERQLPEWKKGVLYDSFTDQPSDPHIAVVKDGFAIPVFLLEFVKPK